MYMGVPVLFFLCTSVIMITYMCTHREYLRDHPMARLGIMFDDTGNMHCVYLTYIKYKDDDTSTDPRTRESHIERLILSMSAPIFDKSGKNAATLNVMLLEKYDIPLEKIAGSVADHAAGGEAKAFFELVREKTGCVWFGLITGDAFHKVHLVGTHASLSLCPTVEMHVCSHKQLAFLWRYSYIRGKLNNPTRTRVFLNSWMSGLCGVSVIHSL